MTREGRILALQGIVRAQARSFSWRGDIRDLEQAGWVGAIKAVDAHRPEMGPLERLAWATVHNEIVRFMERQRMRAGAGAGQALGPGGPPPKFVPLDDWDLAVEDARVEMTAFRLDVRLALGRVSRRDAAVALLVSEHGPVQVSRALGCSPRQVNHSLTAVREALAA